MPEPERRFVEALSKRPGYATLGIVSPTGPAPDIIQALAPAETQPLAGPPALSAELQRLLQTPMPMPATMPVPVADPTGGDVKRQRTTGDFVTVTSGAAELGAQSLNPQVVLERLPMAQLQASMPLQPAPAVAALSTAQTTEIVAPTPTVPS